MSSDQDIIAFLVQERDEARAIARRLAHAIKLEHTPDPEEGGSCYGEYPCRYREVLDAFDALSWPKEPR